jgi:hypothetical protein
MPEIYHIIIDLQFPRCLAVVLMNLGILNIEIFKKYFDFHIHDDVRSAMARRIEY